MNNFLSHFQSPVFKIAWKTLLANPGRSTLSILGVAVGVLAVVLVSVLGEGVKGFVLGQVESFGTDIIQVEVKVPQTGKMSSENVSALTMGVQITTLTLDDAEGLRSLPNVEALYAGAISQELAHYQSVQKRVFLFGTGGEAPLVDENIQIEEGRFFTEEESDSLAQVVVLGSETKETFFGSSDAIGESITLRGERYRVIGVLASRGTAGFINLDSFTYVPIETLQKKLLGVRHVQMISVKMENPELEEETVADIVSYLRRAHDIETPSKDDFAVTSIKEAQETLETILNALSILLIALTSISLVVGGVGIMNVMYVSVTERTSEIGLRKAVGATSEHILWQFLIEAVAITLAGGLLGILVGYAIVWLAYLGFATAGFSLTFSLTLTPVILGTIFSVVVGLIFGIAPAYQASQLSPMTALRRE